MIGQSVSPDVSGRENRADRPPEDMEDRRETDVAAGAIIRIPPPAAA